MKKFLLILIVVCAGILANDSYGVDFTATGSVDQGNNIEINAYPNPTNGEVTIEVNGDFEIKIYDLVGQTLQLEPTATSVQAGSKKESYNLSGLPKGIYFIKVSDLQNNTHKMVKVKRF